MVWIRFGQGRRRGYGGYGYPGGYGYGRRGGGGGGCLRDLFLMETGCCLAEAMGCGPQLVLLAPSLPRVLLPSGDERGEHGPLAVRLVRLYRSRVSAARERPCCRMTPSCSGYAVEALTRHGTARGLWLTTTRLLRCRPGGRAGYDPVPT